MRQTYAIIGLGRFGGALLETLVANGQDVLGIDVVINHYLSFRKNYPHGMNNARDIS